MDKKTLRKEIRLLKAQHTTEELQNLSDEICRKLLAHPMVRHAPTLLLYWSLPDEVSTPNLISHLLEMGKTILLPKVVSDTEMTIHRYEGTASMEVGSYGILEPCTPEVRLATLLQEAASACLENANNTDTPCIVGIIPGMSFDSNGHRLGRGKGYYDRFLSTHPYIYKIGVCFPFQKKDVIPFDEYDVVMDEII